MNERNRMRLLWAMAAMVVVYALVNVIVYFVSGSYGTGWFLMSLAVYGLVLVGAILLLVVDRAPAPAGDPPAEDADATPEALAPEGSVEVAVVGPLSTAEPPRAS